MQRLHIVDWQWVERQVSRNTGKKKYESSRRANSSLISFVLFLIIFFNVMIKKHDSFAIPSGDLRGTQFRVYYNDCVGSLRAQDARTI